MFIFILNILSYQNLDYGIGLLYLFCIYFYFKYITLLEFELWN